MTDGNDGAQVSNEQKVAKPKTPRERLPYQVTITGVDNGWEIHVGCKIFVVEAVNEDKFFAELIAGLKGERTAFREQYEVTGGNVPVEACQPMTTR